MPILHSQSSLQAQAPDGTLFDIPSGPALVLRGPVLQVTLSVPPSVAEPLLQQGKALPEPISGYALIDTGASTTCIDAATAVALQLPVIDTATIASASHAATQQNVYPVRIEITGTTITIEANRAMGAVLEPQGLHVLIGRDVLQQCTLFYNGPTGQITLSI